MFDQQNYINNYIKNSYESIKVRLRKDNALLINSSVYKKVAEEVT